ncbi:hypothetical protein B0A55_11012 [Friedmanniomyces simplex]|uniref:Uncharacterized protein n=1 Tax=Friedmanniomyces simplex TaxID=329884 RepID=A0A4U0WZ02_9PEZI|nr:hypothetical protein B0A55_11012 [Friedmanniomyces simplex]
MIMTLGSLELELLESIEPKQKWEKFQCVEDVAESKSGSRSGRADVKFRKPVDAERTLKVQEVVGHISASQRNLIPQHSSSAVFEHNYLSRYITQDTQAAYRGLEPQTAIIRAASGMSRSIDPHRPRSLAKRQLAKVDRHPEVVLARRVRDRVAKSIRARHTTITRSDGTAAHEEYQQAQRAYLRTKREARKCMMK